MPLIALIARLRAALYVITFAWIPCGCVSKARARRRCLPVPLALIVNVAKLDLAVALQLLCHGRQGRAVLHDGIQVNPRSIRSCSACAQRWPFSQALIANS